MKGIGYYAAVAQIIPILVLVLVVEFRALAPDRMTRYRTVVTATAMLVAVWGELTALAVLKEEKERAASYWFTLIALIILSTLVVAAAEGVKTGVERRAARRWPASSSARRRASARPPRAGGGASAGRCRARSA